jgi:murein DD-endopeptidase MepM/ murein hydrolase activator NlpD
MSSSEEPSSTQPRSRRTPTDGLRDALHAMRRHWRATRRLLRVDAPTMWRLASHVVVLSLSLGIVLTSRLLTAGAGDAAPRRAEASPALRAGVPADGLFRMPDPVVGDRAAAGRDEAPAVEAIAVGFVSPGVIAEADRSLLPYDEPQLYIVQQNDTLSGIAASFGLAPEKLLYYNPDLREDPHNLSIGDELTILPVEGVVHVVKEGETLASIAEEYEVAVAAIVAYEPNGLDGDSDVITDDRIVVPGGEIEVEIGTYLPRFKSFPTWAQGGASGPAAGPASFHIAAFGRLTQGYWGRHAAVDLAAPTGTPIYAIESASVVTAGWLGWAGNAVILDHGNGYRSLYAHMNSISVRQGQSVQRGQIIGSVGCTRGYGGRCTGPHLHLEIYRSGVPVNPCAYGACP